MHVTGTMGLPPGFQPGQVLLHRDEVLVVPEYRYWAWLSEGESSVDAAREVIRTWTSPEGLDKEESHTPDGWQTTGTYRDVRDQHKRGYLLPITAEDVERLTRSQGPSRN